MKSQPAGCLAPTLLILGMSAAAGAIHQHAAIVAWVLHSDSFLWVVGGVLVLLGLYLLTVAIAELVMFLTHPDRRLLRDAPPPVPTRRDLEELPPLDDKARDGRARFTSLIAVLGLLAVPVIAFTR